jgi:shikimate kinase
MELVDPRPIALVGLIGAGKSSIARLLAARLAVSSIDLDRELEVERGCTIAECFARDGESEFRRLERAALERAARGPRTVIACGGGVVLDPANRETLKRHCRVVWLEVEPEVAWTRVRDQVEARPLLANGPPGERLATLLAERRDHYAEVAELKVATDGLSPEAVVEAIVDRMGLEA